MPAVPQQKSEGSRAGKREKGRSQEEKGRGAKGTSTHSLSGKQGAA